jgi:CCR4-NOT transcription complex subunit 7/8
VDLLKIIQLGLTFLDSRGHMPEGVTTWQFNFRSAPYILYTYRTYR